MDATTPPTSSVEDISSPDGWRQSVTRESARPDDLPQVHFDYDEQDVMSLNLVLSGQRTRDVVAKLHDLETGTRLLSLGEAFTRIQTYALDASLDCDERQYRMSLAWQVHQELKRLSSSFHEPWTTEHMTEFCHLMLGVLVGAPCLKGTDIGRLDKVFTIKEKVWFRVNTAGHEEVRNMFFDGEHVNPHGLHITRHQIESRLGDLDLDEQTRSYILSICGQLTLTSNRLTDKFKIGYLLVHEEHEEKRRSGNATNRVSERR